MSPGAVTSRKHGQSRTRRVGLLLLAVALASAGCGVVGGVFGRRPVVDVSGKGSGTWRASEFMGLPGSEAAPADLPKQGSHGTGRFVLHTTGVAAGMPVEVKDAGLTGLRVRFDISGRSVVIRHELSSRLFTADFRVEGDHMVGRVRGADPEVRVALMRVRPPTPVAAAPAASVAAAAPQPPSSPPGPTLEPADSEPSTTPQPIAAASPPPLEPTLADPARPGPNEFTENAAVKPIYFEFDKYDIRPDDAKMLAANAEWLKTNPATPVLIEGHCDERGTTEYNIALGERRARAARNYLISSGIAAERISIVSFGAERGVCTQSTEGCWSKNRRAIFRVGPR